MKLIKPLILISSLTLISCGGGGGGGRGTNQPTNGKNAGGGGGGGGGGGNPQCGAADEPDQTANAAPLHEKRQWEPPPKRPASGNAKMDQLRDDEDYVLSAMEAMSDQEIDKAEDDLLKVGRILAGQQGSKWLGASGKPAPSSDVIETLRKEKAAVKFKERKSSRGSFTLDQEAFFVWYRTKDPDGTKHQNIVKAFTELKAQVDQASSMMNRLLTDQQQSTVITVGRAQFMTAARKKYGGKLDDKDLEHIRISLGQQKRVEVLAAIGIGLMATFQGAIKDGKNPKAIDAVSEATTKGLPVHVTVTADQAKQYVEELPAALKEFKGKLEEWQIRAMGKEEYEAEGKARVQAYLAQLDKSDPEEWSKIMAAKHKDIVPNKTSSTPSRADKRREARASQHHGRRDPACDQPATGRTASNNNAGGGGGGAKSPGDQGLQADANNAMQGVDAARRGDVGTALDRAAKLSPSTTVRRALEGAAAVSNGDVKGALGAAIDLAPIPGPIQDGLKMAMSLFG